MAEGTSVAQLAAWWDGLDETTKGVLSAVAREAPDTVKKALGAGDDFDISTGDLAGAFDAAPKTDSGLRVPYIAVENLELTTEPYEPKPNEQFSLYWVDVNQGADSEAYTDQIAVTGAESQSYTLDCAALATGASGQRTIKVGPFPEGQYTVILTTNSSAPDPSGTIPPAEGYKGGTGIELRLGEGTGAASPFQALNDAVNAVVSLRSVNPYKDAVEADGYLKTAIASTKAALSLLLEQPERDFDMSPLRPKTEALDGASSVLQGRNAEQVMLYYQDNPTPQEPELDSALTTLQSAAQAVMNRGFSIKDDAAVAELEWLADCLVDVSYRIFH